VETVAFASAELMQDRSGGEISPTSHTYLERELKAATQRIRNFCGWHVAKVETLTYRHAGPFVRDVWLPAMEIASIDSVRVNGTVWETPAVAGVEFDPDTGWTNLRGRDVLVTFTAGYAEVPADIEALTLELAAVGLGTSLGFSRQQAGAVSVSFDRSGGGLSADAEAQLAPYRVEHLP